MTAYEYIKNTFVDIKGEILFIEFPHPDDVPLGHFEGEPRLRMIITRDRYRYAHEFPLREYEFLLGKGEIDRPLNQLKDLIEKAFEVKKRKSLA